MEEKELTFTKACETAISKEAAAKDSSLMGGTKDSGVHELRERKQRKGEAPPMSDKPECHRCGRKGHEPSQCRFIQATCHNWHGKGQHAGLRRKLHPEANARRRSLVKRRRRIVISWY